MVRRRMGIDEGRVWTQRFAFDRRGMFRQTDPVGHHTADEVDVVGGLIIIAERLFGVGGVGDLK